MSDIYNKILLFSDGAAKGNPGPAGWGVVIATPEGEVTELGGGARKATNNQMELAGVIEGLKFLEGIAGEVSVLSDSTYVLQGISGWIFGWMRRGWKTASGGEVANIGYWKRLNGLVQDRKGMGAISWHYIRGHVGTPGNERCDAIASGHAAGRSPRLYRGALADYGISIHDLPDDTSLPESKSSASRGGKKQKPHCYLSLVSGAFEQHASWPECEARVKGVKGARFKKAMTPADVSLIKRDWGL